MYSSRNFSINSTFNHEAGSDLESSACKSNADKKNIENTEIFIFTNTMSR